MATRLSIEPGSRFIEKQQIRIADKRAGQGEPLLLSAGKAAHARIPLVAQLQACDHFRRFRPLLKKLRNSRTVSATVNFSLNCVSCS